MLSSVKDTSTFVRIISTTIASKNGKYNLNHLEIFMRNRENRGRNVSGMATVVQKVDSAVHRINLYPLDTAIGFPNTCLAPVVQRRIALSTG